MTTKLFEGAAGGVRPASFMALAHQLGLLIDGAIVVAMISRDPGAARLAAEAADSLFAALDRGA